ncbi:MAG: peptide chain release factor N(5)-glutamine methyltransferase [Candidatus Kapabacteria bacterium]|nr:peptide chain release factor N(5)-glutamine methyltransferase [Candidatus Kapabacteria bacterium]
MQARRPEVPAVWTVRDLVNWGKEFFTSKGIDEARLTIELMVCSVLSIRRIELYTDHDRPLTKEELARLRAMVQRRVKHEPLQYIIGTADFYGRSFEVNPSVLIPRPETEILVDLVLRHARSSARPMYCLDIGTGSGIIPVTVAAEIPETTWTCMDISEPALSCAHSNALRHGVGDRLMFVDGSFLELLPAGAPWDIITMNPPYIAESDIAELQPEVRDYEPEQALTDHADGLTFYRRFADVLGDALAPDGRGFLEIGHGQARDVVSILESAGARCEVRADLAGIERTVIVSR